MAAPCAKMSSSPVRARPRAGLATATICVTAGAASGANSCATARHRGATGGYFVAIGATGALRAGIWTDAGLSADFDPKSTCCTPRCGRCTSCCWAVAAAIMPLPRRLTRRIKHKPNNRLSPRSSRRDYYRASASFKSHPGRRGSRTGGVRRSLSPHLVVLPTRDIVRHRLIYFADTVEALRHLAKRG
jgi:hypothetical protein